MLFFGSILVSGIIVAACAQQGKQKAVETAADANLTVPKVSINVDESKVVWSGSSLGMYTHIGTVNLTEADLIVNEGQLTGGSFKVDLTSMVATDENFNVEEGYSKEKLIGHLSSPDFFDVAQFPTASFKITSVEGNSAKGTLSIRGISKEESVENLSVVEENGKVKILGDMVFNRKDYDVSWDYSSKDMLLKKEVELKIELVGV